MNVPFVDLQTQYQNIKSEIQEAINEVLDSSSYILGEKVEEFESGFAKAHNVKFCSGLSTGTDGNHLALWALGIKRGDEVILPANTFIATAWGVTLCGATPVFVDCEDESYNIDPSKIEEKITKNTKAIIAVHLYGQPSDLDKIKKVASDNNLYLLEDAAQAHLAEYNSVKIGNFGLATSFSFYPGKNLGAYGEGGAIVTNDEELSVKFRTIRNQGSIKKYYHEMYGHNYRMEGIQGAILGVKLKYLQKWTKQRQKAAAYYKEILSGFDRIRLPKEMSNSKHVYHLFVTQVKKRNELQKFLEENGVSTVLHYPVPLHLQKCFNHLGYKKGDFPITETLAENCLSLPMFPEITNEQIEYVCDNIKRFYSNQY